MIALAVLVAALQTVTVHAPNATLSLEVADTYESRAYGLMYRTHLAAASGMIFVFNVDGPEEFWMKNTLIPLDMIFVHADGTISSIDANVPASKLGQESVATRFGHGKFVIELGAGEARKAGLKPGLRLSIPHLEPHDAGAS